MNNDLNVEEQQYIEILDKNHDLMNKTIQKEEKMKEQPKVV